MTQENKDAQYREEYFNYCNENEIDVLDVEHLRLYLAGRKKGEEEKLLNEEASKLVIQRYEKIIIELKKEIEGLKMKPILHRVSNAFRDQKSEIDELRDLVEQAKPLMYEAEQSTGLVHRMREWLRGAEALK